MDKKPEQPKTVEEVTPESEYRPHPTMRPPYHPNPKQDPEIEDVRHSDHNPNPSHPTLPSGAPEVLPSGVGKALPSGKTQEEAQYHEHIHKETERRSKQSIPHQTYAHPEQAGISETDQREKTTVAGSGTQPKVEGFGKGEKTEVAEPEKKVTQPSQDAKKPLPSALKEDAKK
jgi:hypothetical protein